MLYESHQMGLGQEGRAAFLVEKFRAEAIPHIVDYWDNSCDCEKIGLMAAALLERTAEPRGFSIKELQGVFSRGEHCVERLEKRGLLMSCESGYRLFSSVLGPWILQQIAAELSEEQTYHEWLAQNKGQVDRLVGKHGGPLKDVLPKVGTRYRRLILTWASDRQTLAAMAGLLKAVLTLAN
jgi:hypothetical protein